MFRTLQSCIHIAELLGAMISWSNSKTSSLCRSPQYEENLNFFQNKYRYCGCHLPSGLHDFRLPILYGFFTYMIFDQTNSKSVLKNHLSFMMSLLHVPASERPSSGWVYSNGYNHSNFCRRCACVGLKYTIINCNCHKYLKCKSIRNVLHFLTTFIFHCL